MLELFVACLFRGSSAVAGVHTLPYVMENQGEIRELNPYSRALLDSVLAAIPSWLALKIATVAPEVEIDTPSIVNSTMEFVRENLTELLSTDVDEQRVNPLHLLRQSTRFATAALRDVGVPPAKRDEFDQQSMPDDVYAFGPLTWRDLSEEAHDAGITWGAWKAATVLTRRRAEGKLS